MFLRAEYPADCGDVRQAVAEQYRGAHHPVSYHPVRASVVISCVLSGKSSTPGSSTFTPHHQLTKCQDGSKITIYRSDGIIIISLISN